MATLTQYEARLKLINLMRREMWGGRKLDAEAAGWTPEDVRVESVRLLREFPSYHDHAERLGVPKGDFPTTSRPNDAEPDEFDDDVEEKFGDDKEEFDDDVVVTEITYKYK